MTSILRMLFAASLLTAAYPAGAGELVKVGLTRTATDIALYVADKRGYFKAEGLDVTLTTMQSAAVMIVPMTSGDIDVMAGSASAGLYNAIARGLDIRLVASKVTTPKGRTSQTLLARKDLFDGGKVKSVADLKGQKIASAAPGTAALGSLNRILKAGGLTFKDVELVSLSFPQMVVALRNKAVAAAFPAEPATTLAVREGIAVPLMRDADVYPGHEIASIMFSGKMIRERRATAVKFLKAFVRGARDHNDGLDEKGMFAGPKGDAIIAILNEYTPVKDPKFFKGFALAYCDPNGAIGMESLREDLALFKSMGLVKADVSADKLVDDSLLKEVIAQLGPYKKSN